MAGLIDSGSDLSILQESYLKNFPKNFIKESIQTESSNQIYSFTNQSLKVLYNLEMLCKIRPEQKAVKFCFTIIENIEQAPPFIIGADFLRAFSGVINYGTLPNDNPSVTLRFPQKISLETYYIHDHDLTLAKGKVNLPPGESQTIKVYFHPCSFVKLGDNVLFESKVHKNLEFLPSYSKIHRDEIHSRLFGHTLVQNIGKEYVKTSIDIEFSQVPGKIVPLTKHSIKHLSLIKTLIPCHFYPDSKNRTEIHLQKLPISYRRGN